MTRHTTLSSALLVLGVALLIAPILVPIQPVLYHDTDRGTMANRTMLEEQGYEIVSYENLSARGQELYVQSLRADGEYTVPLNEGASDFAYPTLSELGTLENYQDRNRLQTVVIERPLNTTSLPPPDEPLEAAEHRVREREQRKETREEEAHEDKRASDGSAAENETRSGPTVEELRQQIGRYDLMMTRTDLPPLTASLALLRLFSAVGGILAIGIGGYVHSKP